MISKSAGKGKAQGYTLQRATSAESHSACDRNRRRFVSNPHTSATSNSQFPSNSEATGIKQQGRKGTVRTRQAFCPDPTGQRSRQIWLLSWAAFILIILHISQRMKFQEARNITTSVPCQHVARLSPWRISLICMKLQWARPGWYARVAREFESREST